MKTLSRGTTPLMLLVLALALSACLPADSRRDVTDTVALSVAPGGTWAGTVRVEADARAAPRLVDLELTLTASLPGSTVELQVRDRESGEERALGPSASEEDRTFRYECEGAGPCVRDFDVSLTRTDDGDSTAEGSLRAWASGQVTCCGDLPGSYTVRWLD